MPRRSFEEIITEAERTKTPPRSSFRGVFKDWKALMEAGWKPYFFLTSMVRLKMHVGGWRYYCPETASCRHKKRKCVSDSDFYLAGKILGHSNLKSQLIANAADGGTDKSYPFVCAWLRKQMLHIFGLTERV